MTTLKILVCFVLVLIIESAYSAGYQEGVHDGWWRGTMGDSMYGTVITHNFVSHARIDIQRP